jgi:enoyl-CoA hydratase/carnithine racemase
VSDAEPLPEGVSLSKEGHLATITINRPGVLNALDRQSYGRLWDYVQQIDSDEDIRVGILTGAGGRAFCVGSDMKEPSWHVPPDQPMAVTEQNEHPRGSTPLIAAIDGYCLGGGLEWALRCDIRIATTRSSFGLPEPRSGTLAGFGLHMLSRLVPAGEAFYLQLTGTQMGAERAHAIGLVQELVSPDQLLRRAREVAEMVLACSPMVVSAIKQTIDFGVRRGLEDSYRFVAPLANTIARTEDAHEGPQAFVERRSPDWKGR